MFGDLLLDELRLRLCGQIGHARPRVRHQLLHGLVGHLDVLVAPLEVERLDQRHLAAHEVLVAEGGDMLANAVVGLEGATQVATVHVGLEDVGVDEHGSAFLVALQPSDPGREPLLVVVDGDLRSVRDAHLLRTYM